MSSTNLLAAVAPGSATRLVQAFELPLGDSSPALVGILVGAIAGVVVFVTAVALVTRAKRTRRMNAIAESVFVVPPYAADAARALPPVVPSNALSARAFAKMGFAFGERIGPSIDPFEEMATAGAVEVSLVDETHDALPVSIEHTQPLVVMKGPPPPKSPDDSAPNPLAVIPATSSAMMRAARAEELSELDYDEDNGDTQIGEPFFDEPPKPRTVGSRPKIRPIQPAGPRFASPLPVVTPPAAIPADPPTVRRLADVP